MRKTIAIAFCVLAPLAGCAANQRAAPEVAQDLAEDVIAEELLAEGEALLEEQMRGEPAPEEPEERLADNGDGTFIDRQTGRVWLRDTLCLGWNDWTTAHEAVAGLANGVCGLRDGSQPGDWRLPGAAELASLADAAGLPAHKHLAASVDWPEGGPLSGAPTGYYWSDTVLALSAEYACYVRLPGGAVGNGYKDYEIFVWPVRGAR